MTHTLAPHDLPSLERLESRMVLAATEVAAVGLSYDFSQFDPAIPPTYRSYTLLGSVSDESTLRYRMRWDGATGAGPASPARDAQLALTDDGAFRYLTPYWTSGSNNGSQFLPEDGHTVGWWRGHKMKDDIVGDTPYVSHSEEQLIVAVGAPTTPFAAAVGNFRFSMIERDTHTGLETIRTGRISIQRGGDERSVTFYEAGTDRLLFQTNVTSATGGSRFTTSAGQQFFLSADGSTLIFADVASADRSIHAGVGVRIDRAASAEEVAGTYDFLQRESYSQESISWTLTLNPDGTFESDGEYVSSDHGSWFVYNNSEIVLRSDSGKPENRYVTSTSGAGLLHIGAATNLPVFSFGTRATIAPSRSDPIHVVPSTGASGEGLVFIDRTHAQWTVTDVAAESGGPSPTGALVTWFDKRTGLAHAAAPTDRGLTVYSELANGAWTFNVLAESLGTGTIIGNHITLTTGPGGSINIVGLSTEGDLIRYVLPQIVNPMWNEWNISENQLDPRGLPTPDLRGKLVAFSTPWGGLNVAGIDPGGHLWNVWTTTRVGRWFVSDLTANAGILPIVSDFDVAVAGSHGIHFTLVNAKNRLTLLSWRPGETGWRMHRYFHDTYVLPSNIATVYDHKRRVLCVAAIDYTSEMVPDQREQLVLFEIDPDRPGVTPMLTAGVRPPGDLEQQIADGLDISLGDDGTVHIFGINKVGDTVHFNTSPLLTGLAFENLSEITL